MASHQQALAAYRNVLRAALVAFKGDLRMLTGARSQARQAFEQGRNLELGTQEHKDSIQHAEDVATILRQNIVQGESTRRDSDTWKLNIHEEIERGDNESIKQSGQRLKEKPAGSK